MVFALYAPKMSVFSVDMTTDAPFAKMVFSFSMEPASKTVQETQ